MDKSDRMKANVTKRTTVWEARWEEGTKVSYGRVMAEFEKFRKDRQRI